MRTIGLILGTGLIVIAVGSVSPRPVLPAAQTALAQSEPPSFSGRLSGVVDSADQTEVTLQSGEQLALASDTHIIRSVPTDAQSFQPGDFVAVTATRQADNTLLASVVNIFPESMRGYSVGQRPMDSGNLMTNATISDLPVNLMTNATVGEVAVAGFTVAFPGGTDEVTLASDARVNRFEEMAIADLLPGTSITAYVNHGAAEIITID